MKPFAVSTLAAIAALLPSALAQTHTDCQPLNTTGCPSMQALGGNATFNFNKTGIPTDDKVWVKKNQGTIDWSEKGATFTIERSGDSPTANSVFYMLFGRFEVVMRAASGKGIISSAILQSEALDEVDWEWKGSNSSILTNYFGKGDTSTFDRGEDFDLGFAPQDDFHNYTIDWTKDRIEWWVDGKKLRTLTPAQAKSGTRYPQTPMNIRLGIWAAGDTKNNDVGVVEWAGGETDFNAGPYTMTVQSVYAKDYTEGAEYSWENMDSTGDWQKVKVIAYVLLYHT
jgi:beta-glucanase (GH16 family)